MIDIMIPVESEEPQSKVIHQYALGSKNIHDSLPEVLESVFKICIIKHSTLAQSKNYAKTLMLTTKSFLSTQQCVGCRKKTLLIVSFIKKK